MSSMKIVNCLLVFKYVTTTFIYLLISFPAGFSDALAMLTKTGFFNFGMDVCLSSIGSTWKFGCKKNLFLLLLSTVRLKLK